MIKINLNEFNSKVGLFGDERSISMYSQLAQSVDSFYPFPISCNALVANLLLYVSNDRMHLDEPSRIASIFEDAKILVQVPMLYTAVAVSGNQCDPIARFCFQFWD